MITLFQKKLISNLSICVINILFFVQCHCINIDKVVYIAQYENDINQNTLSLLQTVFPGRVEWVPWSDSSMSDGDLLTQWLYANGRKVESAQIMNENIMNTYQNHIEILKKIPVNEVWMILEDDVLIDSYTIDRLDEITADEFCQDKPLCGYHRLNLNPNIPNYRPLRRYTTFPPKGAMVDQNGIGFCPRESQPLCRIEGAGATLTSGEGAKIMVENAYPVSVTIDFLEVCISMFKNANFRYGYLQQRIFSTPVSGNNKLSHTCILCDLPSEKMVIWNYVIAIFTVGGLIYLSVSYCIFRYYYRHQYVRLY